MAARKKNRLKTKYPVKLRPVRPATRPGQNTMAIQMIAIKVRQRTDMAVSPSRVRPECSGLLPGGSAGYRRRCRTGPPCAPPGHHPGRGDLRWS
jgi:hypothetical protein